MGLDINSVQFLVAAHKRGGPFGDVLMIGRQDLNVYPVKMRRVLTKAGLPDELFAPDAPDTRFAEPGFKSLGARSTASLEASAFEGAEFVHDLNQPVSAALKQQFDLVYDAARSNTFSISPSRGKTAWQGSAKTAVFSCLPLQTTGVGTDSISSARSFFTMCFARTMASRWSG